MILAAQYTEPSETMSRWWLEVILTVGCQDVKYKHHYDNSGQSGHTKISEKWKLSNNSVKTKTQHHVMSQ